MDYDLDNRIIKVDVDNNDVEYRYDALGRRVIRQEGTTKTALIWWGNSECAEHKHQAGQTVIQNDIMAHPSRLNSVIARAVDGSKFKLEWYHKNYLDHVYAVSDDSGDILEHYRYTAFGEVQIYNASGNQVATTQIDNHILWNTRRRDELTGYYLYKFRHYSAELGRWLARDPIEERGGVNLYTFVGNDSIGRWDYLGLNGDLGIELDYERDLEDMALGLDATKGKPEVKNESEVEIERPEILTPYKGWEFDENLEELDNELNRLLDPDFETSCWICACRGVASWKLNKGKINKWYENEMDKFNKMLDLLDFNGGNNGLFPKDRDDALKNRQLRLAEFIKGKSLEGISFGVGHSGSKASALHKAEKSMMDAIFDHHKLQVEYFDMLQFNRNTDCICARLKN